MFNEATQKTYKTSYDEYYTERRIISDMIVQHDKESAQQLNSPKNLIRAHQTKKRIDTPNKNDNVAIFDNLDLRKYIVQKDSVRYPRDNVSLNDTENHYIEQYKDLKLSFKEYIGKPIKKPLLSYQDGNKRPYWNNRFNTST